MDQRSLARLLAVAMSVATLVVWLTLMPVVLDLSASNIQDPNTAYFAGAGPLQKMLPLLYAVGGLGLSAGVFLWFWRHGYD